MTRLPQVLRNVRVAGKGMDVSAALAEDIAAGEAELGDHGRVLVRASGTEPLVRVMVEAPTAEARPRRRPPGSSPPWSASGPAEPAGTLWRSPNRKATTSRVRHHRPPARARRPTRPPPLRGARPPRRRSSASLRRGPDLVGRGLAAAALLEELDELLRSARRRRPARARPRWSPRGRAPSVAARRRLGRRRSRPALDADGAPDGHTLEEANAPLLRLKDALWAVVRDRLPTASTVRELVGGDPVVVRDRDRHLDPAGAVGPRPARGARPRLGRPHRAGARPRPRPRRSRRRPPGRPRRAGDPLFRSNAVRTPEGHLSFVYKAAAEIGELGDNTAAHARRRPRRRPAPPGAGRRAGARPSCSATPAGRASGSSPQPNAHPVDSLEIDGAGRPVRHGRPQRRRRQLRRPEGRRRPAPGGRDHHRRQGDPHARLPPPRRGRATLADAFRRHRRHASRARSPSAPAPPPPGPPAARPARQRAGAVRRPGRRTATSWPASRTALVEELTGTLPPPRRRDARQPGEPQRQPRARSSCSTARRAGELDGHRRARRTTAPTCPSPRTTSTSRRSPRATSTAATLPALPPQGDHRGARRASARRCAASSSSATGGSRARSASDALPGRRPRGPAPTGRIGRVQVIGQGTAAVAGQSLAARSRGELPDGRLRRRGRSPPPSSRASGCAPT